MSIPRASQVFRTHGTSAGSKQATDQIPAVNPSGGQPGIINSQTVDDTVGGYADSGVGSYWGENNKADEVAKGYEQEQHNTDPEYLNKWQNSDYARDGGQYGRANNRSYNTTLQLSREGDAYNNRPAPSYTNAHRVQGAGAGHGVTLTDASLQRPKIETEEMREMQKSRQLDLNQKQLAQSLQAAVNRKDLDAFIQLFQQRYNMNLTRYQADLAMRTFQYQELAQQVLFKDKTVFNILADLWGLGLKAQKVWDISRNDPGLAAVYVALVTGQNLFSPEQVAYYKNINYAKTVLGLDDNASINWANRQGMAAGAENAREGMSMYVDSQKLNPNGSAR